MKTKHFARAISRERIMECENIGIALNEFVSLSLEAMKEGFRDIHWNIGCFRKLTGVL
jgi:predicted hydrolase (HD superfamily)